MVRHHRLTVPALIAAFLLGLITIVPAAANNTAQTLPFSQNWSNTSLINLPRQPDHRWARTQHTRRSGVIGFLGQDITTAMTGSTDPAGRLRVPRRMWT